LDLYVRVRSLQSGAHAEPNAHHSSGLVRSGGGVSTWCRNAHF
jgi:hypothetical protein